LRLALVVTAVGIKGVAVITLLKADHEGVPADGAASSGRLIEGVASLTLAVCVGNVVGEGIGYQGAVDDELK
jgi:hypothetical protein